MYKHQRDLDFHYIHLIALHSYSTQAATMICVPYIHPCQREPTAYPACLPAPSPASPALPLPMRCSSPPTQLYASTASRHLFYWKKYDAHTNDMETYLKLKQFEIQIMRKDSGQFAAVMQHFRVRNAYLNVMWKLTLSKYQGSRRKATFIQSDILEQIVLCHHLHQRS